MRGQSRLSLRDNSTRNKVSLQVLDSRDQNERICSYGKLLKTVREGTKVMNGLHVFPHLLPQTKLTVFDEGGGSHVVLVDERTTAGDLVKSMVTRTQNKDSIHWSIIEDLDLGRAG